MKHSQIAAKIQDTERLLPKVEKLTMSLIINHLQNVH